MEKIVIRIHGVRKEDKNLPSEMQRHVSLEHMPIDELYHIAKIVRTFLKNANASENEKIVSIWEGSGCVAHQVPTQAQIELSNFVEMGRLGTKSIYRDYFNGLTKISKNSELEIDLSVSDQQKYFITPTQGIDIETPQPMWFWTELYVRGKVTNIGGKAPNIHISTQEYGEIIIPVTEKQAQSFIVYKLYEFNLRVKQNDLEPDKVRDVSLISFTKFDYTPITLEEAISHEKDNWKDVDDPVSWVRSLRGEYENDKN